MFVRFDPVTALKWSPTAMCTVPSSAKHFNTPAGEGSECTFV